LTKNQSGRPLFFIAKNWLKADLIFGGTLVAAPRRKSGFNYYCTFLLHKILSFLCSKKSGN